jgi:thiamine monophosphate synthase
VQLPESGLPLEAVRRYAGTERILGRSVHDLAGAQEAAAQGADIVIAAPVFEVPGKGPALGLNGMKKMHEAIQGRALLFALGGIEQHKLDELSPFVDGFAAIRSIWRNDLVHAPVFLLDQSPPGPT